MGRQMVNGKLHPQLSYVAANGTPPPANRAGPMAILSANGSERFAAAQIFQWRLKSSANPPRLKPWTAAGWWRIQADCPREVMAT